MEPGSKQISTKNRNAQRSNHSLLSDECLKGEVKKEIKKKSWNKMKMKAQNNKTSRTYLKAVRCKTLLTKLPMLKKTKKSINKIT